jgi:molybdopterin synthase sulfur carrier subunit
MSCVSIGGRSDSNEIRASESHRRFADAGQRLFISPSMRSGGRIIASDVSPKEIARAGVLVRIPPALRSYTDGQDEVVLEASNVAAMLHALDANFPGIRDRVVDEAGRRRPYVNVFVNEELIGASLPQATLNAGDVVHILPSVAGG